MNWQEIMNQISEMNELQQVVVAKSKSLIIKKIADRHDKYGHNLSYDLKKLNNACLEHKIAITPYQIIILNKINRMKLPCDIQSLYKEMPKSQEGASKYIKDLKEKFELVDKSFDLVIDMETLSEIEYQSNEPFENTEYVRKTQKEKELFIAYVQNGTKDLSDTIKKIIDRKQVDYLRTLSVEQKKNLLVQTLTLSYDRNAFEFFDCYKFKAKSLDDLALTIAHFQMFKQYLKMLELSKLEQLSLSDIYDEFKPIYETDLVKQKVIRK